MMKVMSSNVIESDLLLIQVMYDMLSLTIQTVQTWQEQRIGDGKSPVISDANDIGEIERMVADALLGTLKTPEVEL